jgi:two-component system sensor histidine kinase AlgZ
MHPIFTGVRKLLWYMAAWLLVGAVIAVLLAAGGVAQWDRAFYFALPVTLTYGFFASSAFYLCRSQPYAKRQSLMAIGVLGGATVVSGFVWLALCRTWNGIGAAIDQQNSLIEFAPKMGVLLFAAGCALYVLSILAHDVWIAFENLHHAKRRQAQSDLLARDAELQLLRSQINPHFLFNGLNSISALTTIDPAGAREMTIALAQFFRMTVALSEKKLIPLHEELAMCDSFLAIEKIRFGQKLRAEMHIPDEARHCLIPPMLLQPLVENAIKHGIRDLDDGGTIIITAQVRDQRLHLTVDNPVDANPSATSGNGMGLKNMRQRIASILIRERN